MNRIVKILIICCTFFFGFNINVQAQFWKKLKKKAEKIVEKEIDETINPSSKTKGSKGKKASSEKISADAPNLWRNFKFVPGENVIFYDDLQFEETGEFPSRWDLVKGNAEVAKLNGEKVIILTAENANIIKPFFDKTGYLGDEFTIEYDVLIPNFFDEKIWHMENEIFFDSNIYNKSVEVVFDESTKKTRGWASNKNFKVEGVPLGNQNDWHHISISYYKGKFKMYYDNKRISNIPKFDSNPEIFALNLWCYYQGKKQHPYLAIKNIRIAHGGGQMYKRIVADGKYVTNGIIFDSGTSNIKKSSLGIINKVVNVLNENKNWKFDIIGHTDNDGDHESNIKLSSDRAEAVKKAIIDQGIDAARLSIIGKGESEPLNTNKTPEEKANNRRVEFVKKQ
ncbi:OmpA family protein [uncultured Tenacibaculum sp.]|uniref:OmpA family protein n=1 Tax=uncultured Tenacibaculum sp. TaxID=174713 RepID=UPI00260543CD|nr:OmpA family protein [uncultured Tenacibaculum sp.]